LNELRIKVRPLEQKEELTTEPEMAILLLAAGSSSRLGRSKQMLLIDGESLLLKSVKAAIGSGVKNITVVLGANDEAHRQLIEETGVQIVFNPNWQKGMGNSLKAGLAQVLLSNPKTKAVITMVCDQPLITATHLRKLISEFEKSQSPIVASFYAGMAGVPALFHQSLFPKLLSLADDAGAKKIIQQYPDLTNTVLFADGEIDIDTEDDLRKFSLW
jgi:molybdenum cofactor cytidylyltransferase